MKPERFAQRKRLERGVLIAAMNWYRHNNQDVHPRSCPDCTLIRACAALKKARKK